ncbi:efflux RND transporter periplasmic adaptor subunit [Alkalisalibacterium limincola]|uniref:Efflux RND transporter periplasmic adaptor subunit n=1 Tax=Alkalisalibacterium limincola TaxID=2699169 RepID=A0A5C8KX98_9GAMM|nr:efflux RND transporter periplasmic adaptor subunit [Alkalisalibacterium limincola]TXK64454.1 efflux RND transporter periplasmic adaptor subunit [Alkalisalibacterium limincola]
MNVNPCSHRLHIPRAGLACVLAVSFALGLSACGGSGTDAAAQEEERPPDAVPVETAQVGRREIAASYSGTATLEAVNEAQVVSKTSGVLLELMVEEGDVVRAGQVLARLDPDRKGLALAQAQSQLQKLQSEYARSEELFARQLVSADQHERLRAELDIQRSAVDIARLEVSYTRITAPIDGVIAVREVRLGNLIQPNQSLFRIVDTATLEAVLNVPERELATMRMGLPVSMQVDAVPNQRFEGRVARVSPVVDSGSGTFRVTTEFTSQGVLRPGMFGRVGVVHDQRADVLSVPRSALIEGDGMTSVFAVRDDTAVRTPVELGYINGTFAEIRGGIEEGTQVVTVGKVTLRDGSRVQVLDAPGQAVPAEDVAGDAEPGAGADVGAAEDAAQQDAGVADTAGSDDGEEAGA